MIFYVHSATVDKFSTNNWGCNK